MAWQNDMVKVLRYLITDIDNNNYTYDDNRLQETIIVSAQLLQSMVDYYYSTYTVDIEGNNITPDPTNYNGQGIKEDGFVNLVSLQAALLILNGEFKNSSLSSIVVKDGPSEIDYRDVLKNKKAIYEDMKDRFNKALYQYRAGNSIAGNAIIRPYLYSNIYAEYLKSKQLF